MSRSSLVITLMPMFLGAADVTVDHVTVAGKELKSMQARLAAAGIDSEYGGPHANHATEMALISFPDGSYLELIAVQPNADAKAVAANEWAKWMQGDQGPCAWAVRVKDFGEEVKRLQAAGTPVGQPMRSGRARPDGTRLDWETVQVGTEPKGSFFPFLIHDFTPRPLRVFPRGKPTTKDFNGINMVVIAVRDLQASVDRFRKAYGVPPPIKQVDKSFGAHLALLGGLPVVLAAPLSVQSWLSARLDELGEGPCAFVLGARKTSRYKVASKTRWFGADISWLDTEKLGWRLGFE